MQVHKRLETTLNWLEISTEQLLVDEVTALVSKRNHTMVVKEILRV